MSLGTRPFVPSLGAVLGIALCMAASPVIAQNYPEKPVQVIVPYLAGGPADTAARVVAQGLSERLGQPFVVMNKPGAGGNIGHEAIAQAAPDGYTLGVGGSTTGANVGLYPTLPYDPLKSFAPISIHYRDANILVVKADSPINSVADLIAAAKAKPGEITFSSSGNGTSTHLSGELFNKMAGVKMTHVPYKGVPPAIADVMGGQVTLMFASSTIVAPQIKAGKLKGLGVTSLTRLPAFPDMPTIAEAGLPGFEATTWTGLMAPAKTPPAIIAKVHKEVVATLNKPEVRGQLESQGFEVVASTPEEMQALIREDIEKWGGLFRSLGTKVQ
ncbi:MAG: tripartite tricarboxylate transporter substrate binding protein [Burkholderiales bacterium]